MTAAMPARAFSPMEQYVAHHDARGGVAHGGAAKDQRVQVEVLLLRLDIHGAAVAFEPGNPRLLDELHRDDRDGFLQVCVDLEEYGVAREYVIAAISLIGAEIGREETAGGSTLPPEIHPEVIRFSYVKGRAVSRSYAHHCDEISRGAAP
jgi:hypothetical protein